MKVIGTFDPKQLYLRQKIEKQDSYFAAMLAADIGKESGEHDVTALFGSNSGELERLYEQMTGKKIENEDDKTVVFAFLNRNTVKSIPSNQNMKYAIS